LSELHILLPGRAIVAVLFFKKREKGEALDLDPEPDAISSGATSVDEASHRVNNGIVDYRSP
jgi:hypothetical protein